MKLVYAIVSNDDSKAVARAVTSKGFYVTKIASTGGFLAAGNTTFMICTEDEKVDELVGIISEQCHRRTQFVPSPAPYGVGTYTAVPIEVSVGGATIFVANIERFEKV